MYGKGLNSFRVRFAMMTGAMLGILFGAEIFVTSTFPTHSLAYIFAHLIMAIYAFCGGIFIYVMTGKLTRPIEAIRASTEAIARGDFDTAINVECMCEIGGLADSFRQMVKRLNSNVNRINTLAYEDTLTGLPNRSTLNAVLAGMNGKKGAVLFIDLDKFKQVNDTLGHEVGDQLLGAVAKRIVRDALNSIIPPVEQRITLAGKARSTPQAGAQALFRFAGDEFIALIPEETDRDVLGQLANRIITALKKPFKLGDDVVKISATIGICLFPEDTTDMSEVINYADLAMYAAKNNGRRQYAFFNETLKHDALEKAVLETELREAVYHDELTVYYQPKVDAVTEELVGVEALVRWQHPTRGLLYPASFMEIAENAGLIDRIGFVVGQKAVKQAAAWRALGLHIPISVNICPSQFLNPDFSRNALLFLEKSGLPPEYVEFELTETIAMQDPENARKQLTALKNAGVGIAIDDFGTGYSNLAQLYMLPFDVLKLDRSLISMIGMESRAEFIITSMIGMAHALGHKVVAEGVETKQQADFLVRCLCDMMQGYYFARPMSPEKLEIWIANRTPHPLARIA